MSACVLEGGSGPEACLACRELLRGELPCACGYPRARGFMVQASAMPRANGRVFVRFVASRLVIRPAMTRGE